MATNCHTGELSIQLTSNTAVTAGRFSYQKKILERRLAEAHGLSFASFRSGSMPPNSESNPRPFSAGFGAGEYRQRLRRKTLTDGFCELQCVSISHLQMRRITSGTRSRLGVSVANSSVREGAIGCP